MTSTEVYAEQFRKISAAAASQAAQKSEVRKMHDELDGAQKDIGDARSICACTAESAMSACTLKEALVSLRGERRHLKIKQGQGSCASEVSASDTVRETVNGTARGPAASGERQNEG